jgi:hypothetical protein
MTKEGEIMKTMKAVRIHVYGGPECLIYEGSSAESVGEIAYEAV